MDPRSKKNGKESDSSLTDDDARRPTDETSDSTDSSFVANSSTAHRRRKAYPRPRWSTGVINFQLQKVNTSPSSFAAPSPSAAPNTVTTRTPTIAPSTVTTPTPTVAPSPLAAPSHLAAPIPYTEPRPFSAPSSIHPNSSRYMWSNLPDPKKVKELKQQSSLQPATMSPTYNQRQLPRLPTPVLTENKT